MNNNTTDISVESIVNSYGYSMWICADNILLVLVPSILGLLSETACFVVFMLIKVNSSLYTYLKAYTVNNFLLCGCLFTEFFYAVYTLGDAKSMTIVNSYFIVPFLGLCYLNGSLLDIVILLERISYFSRRVREWLKMMSLYSQIIILALVSFILTIPFFFLYAPLEIPVYVPDDPDYAVWISGSSTLSSTQAGLAIIILIVTVDYVLVMLVHIALNILSFSYLRKHLKEKKTIMRATHSQANNQQNVDVKNSIMVTILCMISFVEHILFICCNIGQFFFDDQINLVLLQRITWFFLAMRRFCDFFFYLYFNKVFRNQFFVTIRMAEDSRVNSANGAIFTNRVSP